MAGKLFLLRRVTDFAPGYFEDTAMDSGSIQLSRSSGVYLTSGMYTSRPFSSEAFFNLVASWNADTPPGTETEMQVRISADGCWSQWFSCGNWSPYAKRGTPPAQSDELARVEGEYLSLADGSPAADMLQMRVLLKTADPKVTPRVRLLAVSTNAAHQMGQEPPAYDRQLSLPTYSAKTRSPSLAGRIASPTALTMMMNRWGADLLPEEVARVAYDAGLGNYENLSFLCAAAAAFGFSCHIEYAGLSPLRREVWLGRAVAARVHYRAPVLGNAGVLEDERGSLPPVFEGATQNSSGHLVAVHGFYQNGGVEYVTISDPTAKTDEDVVQDIPVSSFAKIYTGLALFLAPDTALVKEDAPRRKLGRLVFENNTVKLYDGNEEIAPARLAEEGIAPATICYTLSEDIAYASAAQRKFYYPEWSEDEGIPFDTAGAAGRRATFYVLGSRGKYWVAEAQVPTPATGEDGPVPG